MPFQTGPRLILAALLATGLVALPAAAQELYQWKDANGVTHYSDTPPPAGAEHSVRYISHNGAASRAASPEAEEATSGESEACLAARNNLAMLKSDGPVGEDTDGDGVADSELDAAQRSAQLQLAEASIRVHCAQPASAD